MSKKETETTIKIDKVDRDALAAMGYSSLKEAVHRVVSGERENWEKSIRDLHQELVFEYSGNCWFISFPIKLIDSRGISYPSELLTLVESIWKIRGVDDVQLVHYNTAKWQCPDLPNAADISIMIFAVQDVIKKIMDEYQVASQFKQYFFKQ